MFKLDDHRIKSIGWAPLDDMPADYSSVSVGEGGITAIDVREQFCGDHSINWFQVWKDNTCVARFNARNVDSILYFEEDE